MPLHQSQLKDPLAGPAGFIASELAAEEASLLASEQPSYEATDPPKDEFTMPRRQFVLLMGSLYMGVYLSALDATIVTTLLRVIASDLNAVANISWIATAYLLSLAAFQPLYGKLSDIFGRRALLVLCCVFFAVGCAVCVTDSLILLVIGRFITGCGGLGLTSLGTMVMLDLIPLRDRGLYQGFGNVMFGLGAASGGIVGGFVGDFMGWRWIFGLQVPLAVAVGLAIYFNLNLPPGSPGLGAEDSEFGEKMKRVDFLGAFFLVLGLIGCLIAASLGGREIAYSSKTFIGLVMGSIVLFVAFVYTELYVAPEPIIPIELMTERTVLSSSLTNWFYTMAVFTYLFYMPVWYASVKGFTATQNGLRLVPNFFGVSAGSVGAGIYMKRTGRYFNLVVCSGFLAVYGVYRIATVDAEIGILNQFTLLLLPGVAYSTMLTVTLLALIAAVPVKYQACTTSIQYTFRSTGSTLGVAVASAIFQNVLKTQLVERVHQAIPNDKIAASVIDRALHNVEYIKEAPEGVQSALRASYDLACRGAFGFSLATVVLGYGASLFMREHVLHTSMDRE